MGSARTVRSAKLGRRELRLVQKDGTFFGMADGKVCVQGADAEDVWRRLHQECGRGDARYFGYDGARRRFLRFFPEGFGGAAYRGDERDYKVRAKEKLDASAPLAWALEETGLGENVLAVYRDTNLLSPFEKVRVQDLLRGPAADGFVRAAARFAAEPNRTTLGALAALLKSHGCDKWTIVTYLPFLWLPERHMFLKPEVTKDYAARVGHAFADAYSARLDLGVYESLIDLVARTTAEVRDLSPRDGIDVQSFIWVVGKYDDEEGLTSAQG